MNFENRINSFEELPLSLIVDDVTVVRGVCKEKVNEPCKRSKFPAIYMEKRLFSPRPVFQLWMENLKEVKFNAKINGK